MLISPHSNALIRLFCLKNILFTQNGKHSELCKTKYQRIESDVV